MNSLYENWRQAPQRILSLLSVLFLMSYFLYFAGAGLGAGFTGDDLMNLHRHLEDGWAKTAAASLFYWSSTDRPLGGVVYLALYELFDFNPGPFRVLCFGFLLANLWLAYHVVKALAGSREVAVLATLLITYHAWFVDLYHSTGTVYELLCFFFYFSAFLYYLRVRQRDVFLQSAQWLWLCLLYLGALGSKEMAVSLPLFLGIYEALYHPPRKRISEVWPWLAREGKGAILTGLITVPYVIAKLAGEGSLGQHPLYRPEISASRFLDAFHLYLNPLFYQDHFFRDPNTIQLLVLMLAAGLWLRSRELVFAWFFLLLSVLPFIFISHYAAFFLYIPSVGWALYIAVTTVRVRQFLSRAWDGLIPYAKVAGRREGWPVASITTFCLLAFLLAMAHKAEAPKTLRHFMSASQPIQEMTRELERVQPSLPAGSRVLFQEDPFPPDSYTLLFLVRLLYDDLSLQVARSKPGAVPPAEEGAYDVVLSYRDGHLTRISDKAL